MRKIEEKKNLNDHTEKIGSSQKMRALNYKKQAEIWGNCKRRAHSRVLGDSRLV